MTVHLNHKTYHACQEHETSDVKNCAFQVLTFSHITEKLDQKIKTSNQYKCLLKMER